MKQTQLIIAFVLFTTAHIAHAQLPQTRITSVFPPGIQAGAMVDVTIGGGTDLDEVDQLVFSHPGLTATAKLDAAGVPIANAFVVTATSDVPPGLYDVRVRGLFGISNPRAFRVDTLVESAEVEPNNTAKEATPLGINAIINARAGGGTDVDFYRIAVQPGQTIVIRAEAAWLDSTMQPLLQLSDSRGRRLADSRRVHSQDATIVWHAKEADELLLKVHDVVFGGGDQFVYRLTVDTRPQVDWVSPAFVVAGAPTPVTVFGRHLPNGEATEHVLFGQPVQRQQFVVAPQQQQLAGVSASAGFADSFLWNGIEGNLIPIGVGSQPAVTEAADAPEQFLSTPFEATGTFGERSDEDIFRFDAKKGDVRVIEMFAQRIGSLADPMLIVERGTSSADGAMTWARVGAEDDDKQNPGGADLPTLSDDPMFRLEVPEDGTYRVRLRDRYGATRGDPRLQYRLSVREPKPEFSLIVFDAFPSADGKAPGTSGAVSMRKGGRYELAVLAYRHDNHNDAITIEAVELPAGLTSRPTVIGPGQSSARLVISAAPDAVEQISSIRITGRSGEGDAAITRNARVATLVHDAMNGLPRTARITQSLVAGVMKDEQPFAIFVDAASMELSQNQQLLVPIRLTRENGFDGKVDLSFYNVPGETDAANVSIEQGKDSAVARLYFKEKAPAGTTTLLVQGTSSVPYRRNPWQADRAKVRVTEAEAAVTSQQAVVTATETALKDAQQAVVTLTEQSKKLTDELAAYSAQQQALRDQFAKAVIEQSTAVSAVTDAQAKLAAVNAAAATPEEVAAALASANDASAAVETTSKQLTDLTAAADAVARQVAAIKEQSTVAEAAKATAESDAAVKAKETETAQASLAEAQKSAAAAVAAKTAADESLKKAEEASKPNNVNVRAVSEPLVIRIHPTPAALAASVPDGGPIKRGGSMAVKVSINRRNNFAGSLRLTLVLPPGLTGITSDTVEVPADQNEATLTLSAAADATVGDLANVVIQATADFNNRTATTDAPVALKVVE